MLIESTDKFGGTTAYSGAGMWMPNNAVLRRAGNKDSIEEAKEYFHAVVGDGSPRDLQNAFVETGARLIDFLEQNPRLAFQVYPWPDYYPRAPHARAEGRHIIPLQIPAAELGALRERQRQTLPVERLSQADLRVLEQATPGDDVLNGGQALIGRLLLAVHDMKTADLRLNTALRSLIVEEGSVVGAEVLSNGKPLRVRAKRGVLLAAGGFEKNDDMRRKYGVPTPAAWSMGAPGNLGQAIQAGMEVGAATDLMEDCWWTPGLLHPDGTTSFAVGFEAGILVNAAGERFANESLPYDLLGRTMLTANGPVTAAALRYWMILDSRHGGNLPILSTSVPVVNAAPYYAAGLWKKAATLSQLAQEIGVPAETLETTIQRYNGFAASGVDADFHRGEDPYDQFFGRGEGPNRNLVPIENGPFQAIAFGLCDLGTKGGLKTNKDGQVLSENGMPIKGLYAAGNTMAAVSGHTYPAGGNPIGASMVFSYLSALHMAQ